MTSLEKKHLRVQASFLIEMNCVNCEKRLELKGSCTIGQLQKYCTNECSIGRKVHSIGRQLDCKDDWSEDELFYLRNNIGFHSVEHLARKLKRPLKAVKQKVKVITN